VERISVEVADIMSRLNRMKNGSEVTVFVFHMIRLWQIWCVCACVCERLCPVYLSFPVSATVMLSAFPTPVETGVSLCAQVTTSPEFLDTWTCQGIWLRSGKRPRSQ